MSEAQLRRQVVEEALSWIGTPYVSNGAVKGRRGGVDCARFPLAVYQAVGLVPRDFDPPHYSPQWHIHRSEEKYMAAVLGFAHEVAPPPERAPLPGDFVLFKIALAFAHGAIVVEWPRIIHAVANAMVVPEDVSRNVIGKRALWRVPKHFFSLWG